MRGVTDSERSSRIGGRGRFTRRKSFAFPVAQVPRPTTADCVEGYPRRQVLGMDIDASAHIAEASAPLDRYRELVSRLCDRSAVTDEEFDELTPRDEAAGEDVIWVPVVVASRVVPRV